MPAGSRPRVWQQYASRAPALRSDRVPLADLPPLAGCPRLEYQMRSLLDQGPGRCPMGMIPRSIGHRRAHGRTEERGHPALLPREHW